MNKGMQHWLAMVAVAVMLMAGAGCDGVNGPRPTSVATLLEHSEAWQGEQVAVQGSAPSDDSRMNLSGGAGGASECSKRRIDMGSSWIGESRLISG